jgi:hypothetical protein
MTKTRLTADEAAEIAISALQFLAGQPALLDRFLRMSGIEAVNIRRAAGEDGFLVGVLEFLLAHEPSLVAFSAHAGIAPERVVTAAAILPGGGSQETAQP